MNERVPKCYAIVMILLILQSSFIVAEEALPLNFEYAEYAFFYDAFAHF